MDRATKSVTEERIVDVQEVNMTNYSLIVRDQYGTTLNLSLQYQNPLVAIPSAGERWTVQRRGSEWFLGRRAERGDETTRLTNLDAGDRRIEAQGTLYLNGNAILFNGLPGLPSGTTNDILFLSGTTWTAGKLVDAHVSSSAAINVTKLSNPSDTTKFLRGDGTWAVPPTPTTNVLDTNTSLVTTISSTAEITLYSYTIPANTLGANKMARVKLLGKGVSRTVGTLTLRVYWGGSVVFTTTFNAAFTANAADFEVWIANRGATNSQVLSGVMRYYQNSAIIDGVTATVNTTSNQDVKFTAQWGTSDPGNDFEKMFAQTMVYG